MSAAAASDGEARVSGPLPGRAAPAAAAEPGLYRVDWSFSNGGRTHPVSTTLAVEGSLADGVRRPVLVSTYDEAGALLVTYPGTAFRDAAGDLHVDARGAHISGPWAGRWSPDSFQVDPYGQVRTADDQHRGGGGWVTGQAAR